MEEGRFMITNFCKFMSKKWHEVLRYPLVATAAYTGSSLYAGKFSILLAIAMFNGMTVLIIGTIFIVWLLLERKKRKFK